MKKIYSTENIVYILLFILVFILGIFLIKYMVSKKEAFFITASNYFTAGPFTTIGGAVMNNGAPGAYYVHNTYGPPNTFVNCYNPFAVNPMSDNTLSSARGNQQHAKLPSLTLNKNEISISFIYHSVGLAMSHGGGIYVCLCRIAVPDATNVSSNSRMPAIFVRRTNDFTKNQLHIKLQGGYILDGGVNTDFDPWSPNNNNGEQDVKVDLNETHLITYVIRNETNPPAGIPLQQRVDVYIDNVLKNTSNGFYTKFLENPTQARKAFGYGRDVEPMACGANQNILMRDLTIYNGALTLPDIQRIFTNVTAKFNAEGGTGRGEKGDKGDKGDTGASGPSGPPGASGASGRDGASGAQGLPGASGAQGPQGIQGIQGPSGLAGAAGLRGADGAPGLRGAPGPAGDKGAAGAPGLNGAMGPMGPAGPAGPAGPGGAMGPLGPMGPMGPMGPRGPVSNNSIASNAGRINDVEDDYCEESL